MSMREAQAVSLCPVSGESLIEERINTYTHLVGLFLSIIACFILLLIVWDLPDSNHLISCSIYSLSLILVYGASTYYHACRCPNRKRILRIVDHACIYLLIAGTYTPFSLGPLSSSEGWDLLWIEWGVAFTGIAIKILALNRTQALSMIVYLAMGWLVIFNLPILTELLPIEATIWLVVGGVLYSLGTLFYLWDTLPYNHAIWHLFVLAGSASHFWSIFHMVSQV